MNIELILLILNLFMFFTFSSSKFLFVIHAWNFDYPIFSEVFGCYLIFFFSLYKFQINDSIWSHCYVNSKLQYIQYIFWKYWLFCGCFLNVRILKVVHACTCTWLLVRRHEHTHVHEACSELTDFLHYIWYSGKICKP